MDLSGIRFSSRFAQGKLLETFVAKNGSAYFLTASDVSISSMFTSSVLSWY